MMRITDALVTCTRCHWQAPCGEMTMTDAELWECDDTTACERRQACLWAPAEMPGILTSSVRLSDEEYAEFADRFREALAQPAKVLILDNGLDDTVVLKSPVRLPDEAVEKIGNLLHEALPDIKIAVQYPGTRITWLDPEEAEQP